MAGRHRRPNAWRRALTGLGLSRTGVKAARAAALRAEVIALRATVATLRADLDAALARSAELETRLAASTEAAAVAAAVPEAPAAPTLDLPLVRLALSRQIGPPLTRDMAEALSSPDRGQDTASVEIVLGRRTDAPEQAPAEQVPAAAKVASRDLPERDLLDPLADRDGDLREIAAGLASIPEPIRKSA
jgi:hypothetical protein